MEGMSSPDSYKLWADMRDVLYEVVSHSNNSRLRAVITLSKRISCHTSKSFFRKSFGIKTFGKCSFFQSMSIVSCK